MNGQEPSTSKFGRHYSRAFETSSSLFQEEEIIQLKKLSACFPQFTENPDENIGHITSLCLELLKGSQATYSYLHTDLLHSLTVGISSIPTQRVGPAYGTIAGDVIVTTQGQPLLIRNLPQTGYAEMDPIIHAQQFLTYFGQAVKLGQQVFGSLSVWFHQDFVPTSNHQWILGICSSLIGLVERQKISERPLQHNRAPNGSWRVMESKQKTRQMYQDATKNDPDYELTPVFMSID